MAVAGTGRVLPAVARGPGHEPAHGQRQPLLGGPPQDGPEGEGHADARGQDGDQDPGHRRIGPQGQHPDDQAGGHGGDLAAPPSGDHPTSLQGGEAVADPFRSVPAVSHRSGPGGRSGRSGPGAR